MLETPSTLSKKQRTGASVNAYLILRQGPKVLLHLRKNTGYCDDMYGLVSGHVEEGEPALEGMIREAREEAGIELTRSKLKVVHVMHRRSNRTNLDIFFETSSWQGEITNREPEKCSALDFFDVSDLPSNTIGYIADAITFAKYQIYYSEQGWNVE